MKKILFVCTGNICRSPLAHAIMLDKLKKINREGEFKIDSAGTHGFHAGDLPDERAMSEGEVRGVSFEGIFSRKVKYQDYYDFDLIFAMDKGHLLDLERNKPRDFRARI
jgi:protein-tyrosine phosphatase